jgi:hypothetical protein
VILFSYFRDNGTDGVFRATREDGPEFKALNNDKPVFTPPAGPGENLTRDPYHHGVFHMLWTIPDHAFVRIIRISRPATPTLPAGCGISKICYAIS